MKKSLLLIVALCSIVSVGAVTKDKATYEEVNGFNIKNLWIHARDHDAAAFRADLDRFSTAARMAAMDEDVVYVSNSSAREVILPGNDTISQAVIFRYDARTGEELAELPLTLNGEPYYGTLCANSIGVDNFNHLWVAPFSTVNQDSHKLYMVDRESGALTLIAQLPKDVGARVDYVDVIGDITLEEAQCNVLGAGSEVPTVFGWHNDQGGDADTWEGFFSGDAYFDITDFYPESQVAWGTAPVARFVKGEEGSEYDGECFYVDGFTTYPTLYSSDGSIIDSFGNAADDIAADELLLPGTTGCNGVNEFSLSDHNFVVYPRTQYTPGECQINVCELGEGQAFSGMKRYWTLPADGLGGTSDGGTRVHCIGITYTQEGGQPAIRLLTFKCYNGIGVYLIGTGVTPDEPDPGVYGDVNGDGQVTAADVSAVYNIILGASTDHQETADVNGDGQVTAADVSVLYNIILGAN